MTVLSNALSRAAAAMAPLPPYPFEAEAERLLGGSCGLAAVHTRDLYLDLAEAVIDQAVPWVDSGGVVVDPVEGHDDRWRGGTAARFACPAAILVQERGREDLLAPAVRALTQLSTGILAWAGQGQPFPAGVLDLTAKEIVTAYMLLRHRVEAPVAEAWRAAVSGYLPETTYTAGKCLASGRSLNNYGVSAPVGEWLRCRFGLHDSRAWVDRCLALTLPLFTDWGMFRDPGDPMLYDLMVRQNLSELLANGYDGPRREHLEELLRRAGLTTLLLLSPCGWAPCGGRSNALLHNEAMAAYICEFQARCWRDAGRIDVAARFREAAWRAAAAVEPYIRRHPMHFIKNAFPPASRHGKDAAYGEYANYALLTASLFARTALVTDDTIPAAPRTQRAAGGAFHLWPAFHKLVAQCGDTQVLLDTRCDPAYDATGLCRLHHRDAPPDLALSMGISAAPKYVVGGAESGRAAALGPCWLTAAGEWVSLAGMSDEIEDVRCRVTATEPAVEWELQWSFASRLAAPVQAVTQRFRLTSGSLEVCATVTGVAAGVGFEIPCLVTDGQGEPAAITLTPGGVCVAHRGWVFRADADGVASGALEDAIRANRHAHYRILRLAVPDLSLRVVLTMERATDQ